VNSGLIDWLLDSDPALRWQVERDLAGASQDVWSATRARIASEGYGARLLALQDPDGQWAGYPFRWQYSALRAADYFLAAARHDDIPPDPRLADAIAIIRAARHPDGTWTQQHRYPGRAWFEVDVPAGEPSKWLTFHCTRVLRQWDAADTR